MALTRAKNKLVVFNNLDQQENNLLSSILAELENKEKYSIKSTELEFNNYKYHENKVANYSIEINKFRMFKKNNNLNKEKNINLLSSYSSWIKSSKSKFEIEYDDKDYEDNFTEIEEENYLSLIHI